MFPVWEHDAARPQRSYEPHLNWQRNQQRYSRDLIWVFASFTRGNANPGVRLRDRHAGDAVELQLGISQACLRRIFLVQQLAEATESWVRVVRH